MLLAMLAFAEARRVQQYVRFMIDSDSNSGAFASRVDGASTNRSARDLELKASLATPTRQERAWLFSQLMDSLMAQMAGNPQLQEEFGTLTGDVRAMMNDPLVQVQSALLTEQLEKVMVDANVQEQAKQLLEQANGVMTQMQTMTDPRLQGEAERLAKQLEKVIRANGNEEAMEAMEAMEAIMANPIFDEYTNRLSDQLEAMKTNLNFPGLATPIAQLMKTLIADPNFRSHARRIAADVEAITAHLTSQNTDGGSSLAEVGRSASGVAFFPSSLFTHRPVPAVHSPVRQRLSTPVVASAPSEVEQFQAVPSTLVADSSSGSIATGFALLAAAFVAAITLVVIDNEILGGKLAGRTSDDGGPQRPSPGGGDEGGSKMPSLPNPFDGAGGGEGGGFSLPKLPDLPNPLSGAEGDGEGGPFGLPKMPDLPKLPNPFGDAGDGGAGGGFALPKMPDLPKPPDRFGGLPQIPDVGLPNPFAEPAPPPPSPPPPTPPLSPPPPPPPSAVDEAAKEVQPAPPPPPPPTPPLSPPLRPLPPPGFEWGKEGQPEA